MKNYKKYILSTKNMNINSTNQEKIKYAEYGTPHTIRAQMLKTILPSL
jgi:hypothetical protein